MKMKSLLLAITFVAGGMFVSKAENASLFQYNKDAVNKEMTQLNQVESYVNAHDGVTLSQLKNENNAVIQNMNLNSNAGFASVADGPAGIPSFVWGFCLSWVGILIVYLVVQDSDETKKALYGCIVSAALYILWWVFVVLIGGGSFLFF